MYRCLIHSDITGEHPHRNSDKLKRQRQCVLSAESLITRVLVQSIIPIMAFRNVGVVAIVVANVTHDSIQTHPA